MTTIMPPMTETCDGCKHEFGEHYESYNGLRTGCGYYYTSQMDGLTDCTCEGFKKIYRYRSNKTVDMRRES